VSTKDVTASAHEIFAQSLLRERKRLKRSQEALRFLCESNMSEIPSLERATHDPPLATIVNLANALDIPPAQLLHGIP
jgi:transcriptional regulator with XRE-family HTH domain